MLPLFALLALAPCSRARCSRVVTGAVVGLFLYRITIVMHDCTHGTLFRSATAQRWIGQLLGAITGIDFRRFSSQHWKHHRTYGQAGRPAGISLSRGSAHESAAVRVACDQAAVRREPALRRCAKACSIREIYAGRCVEAMRRSSWRCSC